MTAIYIHLFLRRKVFHKLLYWFYQDQKQMRRGPMADSVSQVSHQERKKGDRLWTGVMHSPWKAFEHSHLNMLVYKTVSI